MTDTSLDHAPVRAFAPVLFFAAFLIGVLAQWLHPLSALAGAPRWGLGIGLNLIGLGVGLSALRALRRVGTSPNPHKPTTALVESGAYRSTRNPMYVSMVFHFFAGLAILLHTTRAFALLPIAVAGVHFLVILPEERYLALRFGDPYLKYLARTRRWI